MNLVIRTVFVIFGIAILVGCSPKTTGSIGDSPTPPPPPAPSVPTTDPGCITFNKSKYPDDALDAHAVYRTFLQRNDLEGAFPHWQKAYELAPAADGKRSVQYTDGAKFYKHFASLTSDKVKIAEYVNKIRDLYTEAMKCYPQDHFLTGSLAYDLFYNFREYSSDEEIYRLFAKTIDLDDKKTGAYVLNPFTDVLIRLFQDNKISLQEAQHYTQKIQEILAHGLANSKEKENYEIVASYAPMRLEELETTEDFYSPAYYIDRYYKEYEAEPSNCEVIRTVYSRLRWGKVPQDDPRVIALAEKVNGSCRQEENISAAKYAIESLEAGKYREAIKGLEQAVEETADIDKKSKFELLIAKIYYAHLKNFSLSRTHALRAAKLKPSWGEPHILIGKLYASSGPLCGPGRGWDSQIVTWPAIDKWQYAKTIDASVANEANKLINQYSAYMPSLEDVFQRGLQEGQTIFVPCWIQESTRIRISK